MNNPIEVANYISERRQESGLTLNQLGAKVGYSGTMVSHWEKGKHLPAEEALRKIEAILGPYKTQVPQIEHSSIFSSWLRIEREKAGLSIQELATSSGVSYVSIWQIEHDKISIPRKQTIDKLEKALNKKFTYSKPAAIEQTKPNSMLGTFQEFNPYEINERPNEPGIYVLYDISERPIYVGQANKISARIKNHEDKFWFKPPIVQTAAYIKVSDEELRLGIETILIKFLKSNAVINKQNVDR